MARRADGEFGRYLSMVQSFPALSRERELELVVHCQATDDPKSREELLSSQLRYVVAIALRYRRYGVPLDELISEGNFGLVHALKKFDPTRGTRFVTYAAYWIRAYVLNHVIRSWSMVGVGSGALRSKMFFRLRRERVRIANLVGEGERADELLAERLSLPTATVASMVRRLDARDVSLDAKVYDGSATTLADLLVAGDESQEESVANSETGAKVRSTVNDAMSVLDKRERYIVDKRLMADSDEELSLAEIGRQLGVSRERARQLEERAKRKLRQRIQASSDWADLHDAA
jgi:RNA polymerase sigma-32 factor